MFPHFKPKPSDDGVKTYALCPFVVPTKLALGHYGKDISPEDARRKCEKSVYSATKSRDQIQIEQFWLQFLLEKTV